MAATESVSKSAYGVTKPVGHVLAAFPSEDEARAAEAELRAAGFADDHIIFFTAEQMRARTEDDIKNAGILANIGQELNLVKAQHDLAVAGHPFLSVLAPQEAQARRVAEIARRHGAERAQRYGRLVIEEMIEPGTGERQVAESPDRGLDPQTRSGREHES